MMIPWWVLLFVVISLVVQESDASFAEHFRKLGQFDHSRVNSAEISPSPAPFSALADQPKLAKAEESCADVQFKCHDHINNITACLPSSVDGSRGSILVVHNDGDKSLTVKVTIAPVNYTYDDIDILRHQIKKINISSNIRSSSSIIMNARTGNCVISFGELAPLEKLFGGYATPIKVGYVLVGTIVLIGGTCTCCKMREERRHLGGVQYKELEMEQPHQSLPYVDLETADNWDQSWDDDDDWDEENAVKSLGKSRVKNGQANETGSSFVDSKKQTGDYDG